MKTVPRSAFLFSAVLAMSACGSAPPAPEEGIEERFAQDRKDAEEFKARQKQFERILTETNRAMERYAIARLDSGSPKSDKLAATLEKHLRRVVTDNFARFVQAATQADFPRNRAIAIAALGLSSNREALDPILNGLASDNKEVIGNSAFALGLLKDPRTPSSYLARVIEDENLPDAVRGGAASSLLQVQTVSTDTDKFEEIWARLLDQPFETGLPATTVSAVRGLGMIKNQERAQLVERYLSHPTPKVRQAAAIAVGRIGKQSSHIPLLTLIGTAEPYANVRLAARKALQALAGGIDRGYDVQEWQRVFQRG